MDNKKVKLNLEDLRVESFETLPELSNEESEMVMGGTQTTGFYLCNTGCNTVVCVYPSGR